MRTFLLTSLLLLACGAFAALLGGDVAALARIWHCQIWGYESELDGVLA
jgi:hypothetical protein